MLYFIFSFPLSAVILCIGTSVNIAVDSCFMTFYLKIAITFLDVRGLINGSNLLVLLDAIYPESTVELFENLYRQQISESYMNFKAFFFHIFSFTYESRYKKFSISKELHSIVTAISSEMVAVSSEAAQKVTPFQTIQTDKFTVTYISTIGNVASFIVNDSTLKICLSGQPYMCNPAEVMGAILNIQDALPSSDPPCYKESCFSVCTRVLPHDVSAKRALCAFPANVSNRRCPDFVFAVPACGAYERDIFAAAGRIHVGAEFVFRMPQSGDLRACN